LMPWGSRIAKPSSFCTLHGKDLDGEAIGQ
jgi:hypothetical protein